jgi:hypothetical protein
VFLMFLKRSVPNPALKKHPAGGDAMPSDAWRVESGA